MHQYCEPLPKDQVVVFLKDDHDCSLLLKDILSSGEKYNFTFKIFDGNLTLISKEAQIRHLIYRTNESIFDLSLSRITKLLEAFSSISLIFEYATDEDYFSSGAIVDDFKSKLGDKVNFIRPDNHDSKWKVSHLKIVDNSICDSVRVKYIPKRREDILVLPEEIKHFFQEAQRLYWENGLYHRSPSDGYFAIRHPENIDWFYITATKTYKDSSFDLSRVTLIQGFDEANNVVEFSGKYLPSSDSVEAAVVFRDCKEINSIIHSHASTKFTRNPIYKHKVTVPIMPYGESALGHKIKDALAREEDGFIIMEEHGEIFVGADKIYATEVLKKYL